MVIEFSNTTLHGQFIMASVLMTKTMTLKEVINMFKIYRL